MKVQGSNWIFSADSVSSRLDNEHVTQFGALEWVNNRLSSAPFKISTIIVIIKNHFSMLLLGAIVIKLSCP